MKIIKNEAAANLSLPLEVIFGQPPYLKRAWEMARKRHISELYIPNLTRISVFGKKLRICTHVCKYFYMCTGNAIDNTCICQRYCND